ncbi:MAG: transcriptional repressor [Oscillospiraceae bacterium]|nr:transcriptional repressor [Oscillospiraceae bacterium]
MNARNTLQKEIIRTTLCSLKTHPTAPMLYELIHSTHPSISRSTVYRVLGQMAEEGAILRLGVAGSENRYDGTTEQHSHIRCRVCGRVDDLPAVEVSPVEDSAGYCIENCSVVYSGVCPACRAEKTE